MRAAPRSEPSELAAARRAIVARSGGLCEAPDACKRPMPHAGEHAHHALMRSHTAGHDPALMLWLCAVAHAAIHANPAESYDRGWLIRGV